jgi:hypothetical protein
MAEARITTTATVSREAISVPNMAGRVLVSGPSVEFSITYVPGFEDSAIEAIELSAQDLIARINAARPAAASTPQEGTTP